MGTGNRTTLIIGAAALAASGVTAYLGLVFTPPDTVQGQLVRLIYVHPAAATVCYVGFGLCALSSLAYLWPRTRSRRWDLLAGASAEVGVVFCVITLVTGSIWGRGSWGVWWTWDARLTLTALLLAVFLGYLALRRTGGDPESRALRCAVAAVCFSLVVPVDHYATTWWRTLHQGDTLLRSNPSIHGSQLVTMLLSFVAFGLIFVWLLIHRYRVEQLEDRFESEGLAAAVAARRAEAGVADGRTAARRGPRVLCREESADGLRRRRVGGGRGHPGPLRVAHLPAGPGALAFAAGRGADVALTGAPRPDSTRVDDAASDTGIGPEGMPSVDEQGGIIVHGRPRRRAVLGSRRRQLVAGVVILGALGFLLARGLSNATQYFKTTSEAVAQRSQLGTRDFRIEGTVENNVRDVGPNVAFTIFAGGTAVNVLSSGSPPQLFKPGIPVVLDGHWSGDVYLSNQIMVKHTASYTEAHPGRLKPQVPPTTAPAGRQP